MSDPPRGPPTRPAPGPPTRPAPKPPSGLPPKPTNPPPAPGTLPKKPPPPLPVSTSDKLLSNPTVPPPVLPPPLLPTTPSSPVSDAVRTPPAGSPGVELPAISAGLPGPLPPKPAVRPRPPSQPLPQPPAAVVASAVAPSPAPPPTTESRPEKAPRPPKRQTFPPGSPQTPSSPTDSSPPVDSARDSPAPAGEDGSSSPSDSGSSSSGSDPGERAAPRAAMSGSDVAAPDTPDGSDAPTMTPPMMMSSGSQLVINVDSSLAARLKQQQRASTGGRPASGAPAAPVGSSRGGEIRIRTGVDPDGSFVVQVLDGRIIPSETGAPMDAFCTVSRGKQVRRTDVQKKTVAPVWNQTLKLMLSPAEREMDLVLYCWEFNRYGQHVFLGGARWPASELRRAIEPDPPRPLTSVSVDEITSFSSDYTYIQVPADVLGGRVKAETYAIRKSQKHPPIAMPPAPEKRDKVAQEIYTTEVSYMNGLRIMVEEYFRPLSTHDTPFDLPRILNEAEIKSIFANVEDVLRVNTVFFEALEQRIAAWSPTQLVGDIFVRLVPTFMTYLDFVRGLDDGLALVASLGKKRRDWASMALSLTQSHGGQDLAAYLITPVQRIPRYELLLKEMCEKTPAEHPDKANLTQAYALVKETAVNINSCLKDTEETRKFLRIGLGRYVAPGRRLLIEESLACRHPRPGFTGTLLNDLLIIAPNRKPGAVVAPEEEIQLLTIWVEDLGDTDPQTTRADAFEVWTPERSYFMYAGSAENKAKWLREIRKGIEALLEVRAGTDIDSRNGQYYYSNGSIYEGQFHMGMRQGEGTLIERSGDRYSGGWREDMRHGQGRYETVNFPIVYDGDWRDDRFVGAA